MNHKRILLKLSGSFFSGTQPTGLDFSAIEMVADEIKELHKKNIAIGVVTGAGNIFRGRERPENFDRAAADRIGYTATLMNALALTETLNARGIDTRIMSSFEVPGIARHVDIFKARKLLNDKKIVIFAGGTGNPYFTTDTAAVLRALEIKADVMLKGTDVDGVYSADPAKDPSAQKYDTLTYTEALDKHLKVMDQTAFALAQENNLEIIVFKFEKGSLARILENPKQGTQITA